MIKDLLTPEKIQQIKSNPFFDDFFKHINKLIESQSGIIKDSPYIMELQGRISHLSAKQKNLSIQNLNGQDRKGEKIKWPSNRENYILIDFWASWHPESVAAQDSLVSVLKELKKAPFTFAVLSFLCLIRYIFSIKAYPAENTL